MALGIRVPDLNVAGAIDDVNDYVVALVNGALKLVPAALLGTGGGAVIDLARLTEAGDYRITETGDYRIMEG